MTYEFTHVIRNEELSLRRCRQSGQTRRKTYGPGGTRTHDHAMLIYQMSNYFQERIRSSALITAAECKSITRLPLLGQSNLHHIVMFRKI